VDRHEAASLLGVRTDASSADVRHAWRVWARIAHPDAGGDPDHFARLDQARRTLLAARPAADSARVRRPDSPPLVLREPLRAVLVRPTHAKAVILAGLGAVLLAVIPGRVPAPLAVAALPAAVAAAAWAVWATREMLGARADTGHRIAALTMIWLPVAAAQVSVSWLAGSSLIPVLPLLAVPLVVAVSAVNPGAGLWRPVGG
jgi:hypothetical protein